MTEWSKETFAKNLRIYIDRSGKNQKEIAEIIGVSAPTLNEWIKAKKYPRIDKIQKLADYFGILKSDLIEDKPKENNEMQKKNDIISNIVIRMNTDKDFFLVVQQISELDAEKIEGVKQLLNAFVK